MAGYRTLFLHCEHGRTPVSKHDKSLPPESWREKGIKRDNCPWRVNFNAPKNPPCKRMTKMILQHNHNVKDPSEYHNRFLQSLTPPEIRLIQRMALLGIGRTTIIKVLFSL